MCALPSRLVALWCWYHGGEFRGYQSQAQGPTVQQTIIGALRAAGFERGPVASGRTDLGVHARMQVLSLRVVEGVPPEEVAAKLAPHLPRSAGIALSRRAGARFNASWQTSGKEYRYRIALAELPRWSGCAWRVDVRPERLAEALEHAVGTRNFEVFHVPSSAVKERTVRSATVHEVAPGLVEVRVVGDAFAKHMVRRLVGAAVGVARGEVPADAWVAGLEAAQRSPAFARRRAPAQGLILWEVLYPPEIDPFTRAERLAPPGLPETPPFTAA